DLKIFLPITKADEVQRMVYGVLAEEALDKSGEIFDYARSKPNFEKWSKTFAEITKGKSVGNLRRMHQPHVAGHFTEMVFNDAEKRIEVAAKVTDDQDWKKVLEGDYTGFSIGGKYVGAPWQDEKIETAKRYEADPAEGSLVDNPCMGGATYSLIRADGASELRKFKEAPVEKDASAVADAAAGAVDALKRVLQDLALIDGDPATWSVHQVADAISGVL